MKYFLEFIYLFLIIQTILTMIEFPWYLGDFVTAIEGGRTQIVRNGLFTYDFAKGVGNYIVFYFFSLLSLYYIALEKNESVFKAFLIGSTACASAETALHSMISRTNNSHIPVLLFDIFITGGFGYAISVYIWNHYKNILSAYNIPLLLCLIAIWGVYLYEIYIIETSPLQSKP
jgi:hypothetical protein